MRWYSATALALLVAALCTLGYFKTARESADDDRPSYDHVFVTCVEHGSSHDYCVDFAADAVAYGVATSPSGD